MKKVFDFIREVAPFIPFVCFLGWMIKMVITGGDGFDLVVLMSLFIASGIVAAIFEK